MKLQITTKTIHPFTSYSMNIINPCKCDDCDMLVWELLEYCINTNSAVLLNEHLSYFSNSYIMVIDEIETSDDLTESITTYKLLNR